jgi:hypothetical protein
MGTLGAPASNIAIWVEASPGLGNVLNGKMVVRQPISLKVLGHFH